MPIPKKLPSFEIEGRLVRVDTEIRNKGGRGFAAGAVAMNALDIAFIRAEREYTLQEVFAEGSQLPNLTSGAAETLMTLTFLRLVAMTACRPQTADDLKALTNDEISRRVTVYLHNNRSLFELQGDKPFLQYPQAKAAKQGKTQECPTIGGFIPGFVSGNRGMINTNEYLSRPSQADRLRALLFAVMMPFPGKKTDKSVWVSPNRSGSRKAFLSPMLGRNGIVHSFVRGKTLLDTVRLNMICEADLKGSAFTEGFGVPAWEKMPLEDNQTAEQLRSSYFGQLLPMLRFVLLDGDLIRPAFGVEPNDAIPVTTAAYGTDRNGNPRVVEMMSSTYWQALASSLGFTFKGSGVTTPACQHLQWCLPRAKKDPTFSGVLLLGLRVTKATNGKMYFTGSDGPFMYRIPVQGNETRLEDKFTFMSMLSAAVYSCLARIPESLACRSMTPEDEGKPSDAQQKNICSYADTHLRLILEDLTDDFAELLCLTNDEEIEEFEREMAQRAREAIHERIVCNGDRLIAKAGRIELNVQSLFKSLKSEEG